MSVNYIPTGYHTITPYIVVKDPIKLISFLQSAFDAEEKTKIALDDGRVLHAEVKIGDSIIMISQAHDSYPSKPAMYYLYVKDTDGLYQRAIKAGAKSILEPTDQFYGDRNAGVEDASGNQWWLATHIEDVSVAEVKRRALEFKK